METNDISTILDELRRGFSVVNSRLDGIESRLKKTEQTAVSAKLNAKRVALRQKMQDDEIDKLKEAVRVLAEEKPLRTYKGGIAIDRADAYKAFDELGISRTRAKRALAVEGCIKLDERGQYLPWVHVGDENFRAIVVLPQVLL